MDFFLGKICEFWDTPTNLDKKMNDLKRKLERLNAAKEDTESRMSIELHPKKKLKKEVDLWFRNVERINDEIRYLQQEFGEKNVVSRGFLKRNVCKKMQEFEELFQQGKFHDTLVVDNPGWIGQTVLTTGLFGQAAEVCMKEIWACLMDADVQKIGLCGMGGIGKTTIMKVVHNQLLKTKKFDIVIWITVSKEPNIIKLQDRIARAMEKTLQEDEDKTIRAGMICEMLSRKEKYVLILDDMWDKLSLEEVGIPEPSNGSKLLVTTRLLDVCHYLDCREVRVPTLSKEDAWLLFSEKVGQDVADHPDLSPIVKSVAEECDGLPLAIVTIAGSMKGVCNIHEWRNALHELNRHVKSVNGMEEKVFHQLQFSYDRLQDEKIKHCFLCCALFPEDCEMDIDELIQLWIAEGLVEEMGSMQREIDKGHAILNKLKNSCLIENVSSYQSRVKLHDVVRDMALRITSIRPRFFVTAGMQLTEMPRVRDWNEDVEKASLMENWQLQIPSQMPPLKCPKLTTLLLSKCYIESIPECFFEQMHGLKILDLSYNPIRSLPDITSNLKSLTTLLLHSCRRLEKVPSFSKLEALKKLNLGSTNIKGLPHGMERLVNLKYLDLNCWRITEIASGILANFSSLQHLAMYRLMKGEEISGLRKLEFFEAGIYDLNKLNSYIQALAQIKRPSQYNIYVTDHGIKCFCTGESEKCFKFDGCNINTDDVKVPSDVKELNINKCMVDLCEQGAFFSLFIPVPYNTFSSLSKIEISNCKHIKKLFSANLVLRNLQNLETLFVVGCDEIEEIFASEAELKEEGIPLKFTLPNLYWFELCNLPELKSVCGANGVMVCDSLDQIDMINCPKLRRISLNLPLQDDGQPSPPPSLKTITISSKQWWELLEWDHQNAKSLLEPYIDIW
ncbi:hypothetical protein PTKIN_Ptkin14bG0112500 [Pterospermum kingtungense]